MAASSLLALIAAIPLLPLLGILLARFALRAWGWSLLSQSRERKAAIVAKVAKDRAALTAEQDLQLDTDDGWEKVERVGEAVNGESLQKEWNGVVGFFHPFW